MPFLPDFFAARVNELSSKLSAFEAANEPEEKFRHLSAAMQLACTIMKTFEPGQLEQRAREIFRQARAQNPQWQQEVLNDVKAFDEFLRNIESRIFRESGLSDDSTRRLLEPMRSARSLAAALPGAVNGDPEKLAAIATSGIYGLEFEICRIKRSMEQQANDLREKRHWITQAKWIAKGFGGVSAFINAGAVAIPIIGPIFAGTSIMVGGVVVWLADYPDR